MKLEIVNLGETCQTHREVVISTNYLSMDDLNQLQQPPVTKPYPV